MSLTNSDYMICAKSTIAKEYEQITGEIPSGFMKYLYYINIIYVFMCTYTYRYNIDL